MATRRKSTLKKKKEDPVLESPVEEEVVEPVAEKEVVKPEPVAVVEPKQPKAEEVPPPVPEEPKPEVEVPVVVAAPVVEQQVAAEPRISIGSIVMTPSGKRCQVVGHSKGGKLKVQNLQNTRKVYAYEPSRLSLAQ